MWLMKQKRITVVDAVFFPDDPVVISGGDARMIWVDSQGVIVGGIYACIPVAGAKLYLADIGMIEWSGKRRA